MDDLIKDLQKHSVLWRGLGKHKRLYRSRRRKQILEELERSRWDRSRGKILKLRQKHIKKN